MQPDLKRWQVAGTAGREPASEDHQVRVSVLHDRPRGGRAAGEVGAAAVQSAPHLHNRAAEGAGGVIADASPDVTVLFADIVDFTEHAERRPPKATVALLNKHHEG
jgi:class 3 adenylate cyclase